MREEEEKRQREKGAPRKKKEQEKKNKLLFEFFAGKLFRPYHKIPALSCKFIRFYISPLKPV